MMYVGDESGMNKINAHIQSNLLSLPAYNNNSGLSNYKTSSVKN